MPDKVDAATPIFVIVIKWMTYCPSLLTILDHACSGIIVLSLSSIASTGSPPSKVYGHMRAVAGKLSERF